ncbi:MAG: 3-dehydroquinate synthase [Aestuariivita sp.]|nr:3-dehydroquinate synthase [Aestuariivita sp.]MCY4345314.1 3-dehydroquinate synthase [Aestuariivita sp.]
MMTQAVSLDLGSRSYRIEIEAGLISSTPKLIAPFLRRQRVYILTDEVVEALYVDDLSSILVEAGIEVAYLALPSGEAEKNWSNLIRSVEWLLDQQVERNDLVIALGGGVIGDLAGFAAAILRRGVNYIQIPTTLLAQVDSSVGGKTGINSTQGKNLIGAFHQPSLVLIDVDTLDSLPERQLLAGYGEVAKYGLLGDEEFFWWLEENGPAFASGDEDARIRAIEWSVTTKAQVVEEDEREGDRRVLLNLGHTFGHALETATGYSSRLLHGEGVTIGCALAFELSARLGLGNREAPQRVRRHFDRMGLKSRLSDIPGDLPSAETLISLMWQDKKVVDGRLRFVLPHGIGATFVTDEVPQAELMGLLNDHLGAKL